VFYLGGGEDGVHSEFIASMRKDVIKHDAPTSSSSSALALASTTLSGVRWSPTSQDVSKAAHGLIIVGYDGSFRKVSFDGVKGGLCVQEVFYWLDKMTGKEVGAKGVWEWVSGLDQSDSGNSTRSGRIKSRRNDDSLGGSTSIEGIVRGNEKNVNLNLTGGSSTSKMKNKSVLSGDEDEDDFCVL
jgi:hypothetical protein